jgi:hypothetical protein
LPSYEPAVTPPPRTVEHGARSGEGVLDAEGRVDTHYRDDTHYVDVGFDLPISSPSGRPPVTVDRTDIAADGKGAVFLTGIPENAVVRIDGRLVEHGGTLELVATLPGEHEIALTHPRHPTSRTNPRRVSLTTAAQARAAAASEARHLLDPLLEHVLDGDRPEELERRLGTLERSHWQRLPTAPGQ